MTREFTRDIELNVGDILECHNETNDQTASFLILAFENHSRFRDLWHLEVFDFKHQSKREYNLPTNEFNLMRGFWFKVYRVNSTTCEWFFAPMGCSRPYEEWRKLHGNG